MYADCEYAEKYYELIRINFSSNIDEASVRTLNQIDAMDHVCQRHILPTFITKISSEDMNSLFAIEEENYLMKCLGQE